MVLKISAFSLGATLVSAGLFLVVSDLAETIRLGSVWAVPVGDMLLGAVFSVVGMSFLWPLRPFHDHRTKY